MISPGTAVYLTTYSLQEYTANTQKLCNIALKHIALEMLL